MRENHKTTFGKFAQIIAQWGGGSFAFFLAVAVVFIWALTGPIFHFSDTWQLVINTGTTIITFLMGFLIQNTQSRDGRAMQLKLDELIRAMDGAHTVLLDLEELSEAELRVISEKYYEIAQIARERLRRGESDTDIPDVVMDAPLPLKV